MYIRKKYAENSRIKRPNKKLKNYDTIFSSKYGVYIKLMIMWTFFFLIDFLMDLRVEIFWSCWLMCRSINETYRYQGLVFTLFFTLTVITSDLICFLLIPTKWLFFLGCTYVWIQLIGLADRSISPFTVGSCVFYVYIEFTFRLRQISKNLSFTLNLCRPFAAHCIGYPVVTMCFELKNYVTHKFRMRRQKEVRRINQFYYELLEKSIPEELRQYSYNVENDAISVPDSIENSSTSSTGKQDKKSVNNGKMKSTKWTNLGDMPEPISTTSNNLSPTITEFLNALPSSKDVEETFQNTNSSNQDLEDMSLVLTHKRIKSKPVPQTDSSTNWSSVSVSSSYGGDSHLNAILDSCKPNKEDYISKLEAQVKKKKSELQSAKKSELEARAQLSQVQQQEAHMKSELKAVKGELPPAQARLQQTGQRLSSEKQAGQLLEKRLGDERRARLALQGQLDAERRSRLEESETNAKAIQAVAVAASRSPECGDICRRQRKELEAELGTLRRETRLHDDRLASLSRQAAEWPGLARVAEEHRDLMGRIATVKDENLHLTEQLRELNKMKQELLTSYHGSQLEIKELDFVLKKKNYQIYELQSKLQSLLSLSVSASEYGPGLVHSAPSPYGPGLGDPTGGLCQQSASVAAGGAGGGHPYQAYSSAGSYPVQSPQQQQQSSQQQQQQQQQTPGGSAGSGRHSSNNSPLYMAFPSNHSP